MSIKTICALVPLAGLSSRMGEFKPLISLCGKTLIENTIDSLICAGCEKIVAVTGFRADDVEPLLKSRYGDKIIIVRNNEFAVTDMLHSIKLGLAAMPKCDAFFLLPGDMPVIKQSTFSALTEHRRGEKEIIFPTLSGYRKHPPLIDSDYIPDILAFEEPGGLRTFFDKYAESIIEVPVDDEGVWVDLDTKEDYKNCKIKYENN